jgi:hypothetical protein
MKMKATIELERLTGSMTPAMQIVNATRSQTDEPWKLMAAPCQCGKRHCREWQVWKVELEEEDVCKTE